MKQEQRFILFFVLSFAILMGWHPLMERLGILPPEPPPAAPADEDADFEADEVAVEPLDSEELGPVAAFAGEPDGVSAFATAGSKAETVPTIGPAPDDQPAPAVAVEEVELVPANQLVLGAATAGADPAADYRLEVRLDQIGAGVSAITLARHGAEPGVGHPPEKRLRLIEASATPPNAPPGSPPTQPLPFAIEALVPGADDPEAFIPGNLGLRRWEVVQDEEGRISRPVPGDATRGALDGEEIVFRTHDPKLGISATKAYTLRKGSDTFELRVRFESEAPRKFSYTLLGPYGLPIEGEWYTRNFREVFFGKLNGQETEVETHLAGEVVDRQKEQNPVRVSTLPLKFTGVENQYFTIFLEPDPLPKKASERFEAKTTAIALSIPEEKQRADVSVEVTSRPIAIAPGRPVEQAFRIYAGPKDVDALGPLGAEALGAFRKGWSLPGSTWIAQNVIAPLLQKIYGVTASVAGLFGGTKGNYGIAIILLTIVVRMMMFPLSRKQAISAKRMQDVKPKLDVLKEKYKDDKQRIGTETMQLYREEGIHPLGGCLIAIIQMPIFFGLWQAVNNSWQLRGSSFLWIDNLAAPDQLFKFPAPVPYLGPYFNLLPIVVVALMLVHMKLFSPPPSSPEQVASQKMMKYMMVVMAFMFYWVPSGLGLYFITSSSWAIAERLLLPKHLRAHAPPKVEVLRADDDRPRGGGGIGRPAGPRPPGGKPTPTGKLSLRDKLRSRFEEVMEEARAQGRTHRNVEREPDRKQRPRPKPGKRR